MMNVSMWEKAVNVIPREQGGVERFGCDLTVADRHAFRRAGHALHPGCDRRAAAGARRRFDLLLWVLVSIGLLFAHADGIRDDSRSP